MRLAIRILGQAVVLALAASALGALINLVRPDGLAWVKSGPFEIFKPCPMMLAEATPVEPAELPVDLGPIVIVDARLAADQRRARIAGARLLPYHPLDAPDPELIAALKTLGPNRLLVIGDVQIDSGRLLAAELSEAGCLGVRYLKGGVDAWVAAGRVLQRLEMEP